MAYAIGHISGCHINPVVTVGPCNTSVNPARSTRPALFVGGWALGQLWLFWLAPIVGAALGALLYRAIAEEPAKG